MGKLHKPTEETRSTVEALSSFGIPHDKIAKYIGVSGPTLRKHYPGELDFASIKANQAVGDFLFSLASGNAIDKGATYSDCKAAAMFWAKTRMGWREVERPDNEGDQQPFDGWQIETI